MNDNEKDIERLLGDLTFDDTPDRRHRDLLEEELLRNFDLHHSKTVGSRHRFKWRIVMNTKITKLAAAAVLLIGAFVGFGLLDGTSSVSWAEMPVEPVLDETNDPETAVSFYQEQWRVRAAVATLPAQQQEALALAYFQGYSHSEIAQILGEPLGTIKGRIRGAMQKLRDLLE